MVTKKITKYEEKATPTAEKPRSHCNRFPACLDLPCLTGNIFIKSKKPVFPLGHNKKKKRPRTTDRRDAYWVRRKTFVSLFRAEKKEDKERMDWNERESWENAADMLVEKN